MSTHYVNQLAETFLFKHLKFKNLIYIGKFTNSLFRKNMMAVKSTVLCSTCFKLHADFLMWKIISVLNRNQWYENRRLIFDWFELIELTSVMFWNCQHVFTHRGWWEKWFLSRERFAVVTSHLMSSHLLIVIFRPYTVVLGADSLSANESTKQEFTSVRSIPHPNYDGHANDIMLIKVSNSLSVQYQILNRIISFYYCFYFAKKHKT